MPWHLAGLPLRVLTHVERRGSVEPSPNREHIVHLPLKSFICGKTTRGRCLPESSSRTLSTSFKEGALFFPRVWQSLSLEAPGGGGAPTFSSRVEHSCGGRLENGDDSKPEYLRFPQQTSLNNETMFQVRYLMEARIKQGRSSDSKRQSQSCGSFRRRSRDGSLTTGA